MEKVILSPDESVYYSFNPSRDELTVQMEEEVGPTESDPNASPTSLIEWRRSTRDGSVVALRLRSVQQWLLQSLAREMYDLLRAEVESERDSAPVEEVHVEAPPDIEAMHATDDAAAPADDEPQVIEATVVELSSDQPPAPTADESTPEAEASPAAEAPAADEASTEAEAPAEAAPKRRTTRRKKSDEAEEAAPAAAEASEAPAEAPAEAAPKRRTTRRKKSDEAEEAAPAAEGTVEAEAEAPAEAAPKRRTTRRKKSDEAEEAAPAAVETPAETVAEVPAEAAPKRRTTRRKKSDEAEEAAPAAEAPAEAEAPTEAAPKRRTTRRKKSDEAEEAAPAPAEAVMESAVEAPMASSEADGAAPTDEAAAVAEGDAAEVQPADEAAAVAQGDVTEAAPADEAAAVAEGDAAEAQPADEAAAVAEGDEADATSADESADEGEGDGAATGESSSRRRRRRRRRGRSGASASGEATEGEAPAAEGDAPTAEAESDDEEESDSADDGEASEEATATADGDGTSSRRKRRRRRRGGRSEGETGSTTAPSESGAEPSPTPRGDDSGPEEERHDRRSYKTAPIPGLDTPEGFVPLNMNPLLGQALTAMGFEEPTPIQRRAVPVGIAGRDVIGLAQTGTGKTVAFLIPAIHRLLSRPLKEHRPRILVLTPTRELALQVAEEAEYLATHTPLYVTTVYGGVGYKRQIAELREGTDIIIATPGRLMDLMARGSVRLNAIEVLVLDEADRMLDMGFLPEIRQIVSHLPKERQTFLFSATMPPQIQSLSLDFQRKPELIEVARQLPPSSISQLFYPVERHLKTPLLIHLLDEDEDMSSVLVFTETKSDADTVARKLEESGIPVAVMHGDRSQREREEALQSLRDGSARVLVATDVAARGLDITGISHVVNYHIPQSVDDYVHRIGRTARGDAEGHAYTFVSSGDEGMVMRIESALDRKVPRQMAPNFNYDVPTPSWAKPSAENLIDQLNKPKGVADRFRRMMGRRR